MNRGIPVFASVALVAALFTAAPTDYAGTSLVFTALSPDGSPAVSAVAVANVITDLTAGAYALPAYRFRPTRAGTFKVRIPMRDPGIRSRYPEQKIFNVRITLYQFPNGATSGRRPSAFGSLNWILNLGDPSIPDDFSEAQGATVRLVALP